MTDPGSPAGSAAEQPIDIGFVPFDEPPPDGDGTQPSRASRGRLIFLGSLLAVGLAGAAVLGTTAYRIVSQKDAALTIPAEVGSLRREDGEEAQVTAEYLRNALSAEVDLDETVGAVYTEAASADRSVLFFGGTTLVWTPERDLDTAFELLSDDTGKVTGLRDVEAGDLGGTMKCGSTASPEGDITVCGWADHGSLALAMFPNRPADDAAAVLAAIRDAAQSRR